MERLFGRHVTVEEAMEALDEDGDGEVGCVGCWNDGLIFYLFLFRSHYQAHALFICICVILCF